MMTIKVYNIMSREYISSVFAPKENLNPEELDVVLTTEVGLTKLMDGSVVMAGCLYIDPLIEQVQRIISDIVKKREKGIYQLIAMPQDTSIGCVDQIQVGNFYSLISSNANSIKDAIAEVNGKTLTYDMIEVVRGTAKLFNNASMMMYIISPNKKIVAVEDTEKGDGFFKAISD